MKTTPFAYNDAGLTRYVKASGCAAKLDPSDLKQYVGALLEPNSNLISSLNSNEDAGVFALGDGRNLVQTVDFITPVVGDPYIYGMIAAANSLSDVFAMGGRALTAMNVVGFDKCHFGEEVLAEILVGAKEKIKECISDLTSDSIDYATNLRQQDCLQKAKDSLLQALDVIKNNELQDLISIDIKAALLALDELSGEVITDEILNNIFDNFCIGK